jgi:FlaA1/EpsC-like NDP-sugar epimerase
MASKIAHTAVFISGRPLLDPRRAHRIRVGRRLVNMNAATVLVTGATGKTGKIIAQKIKDSDDFELRALTRSEKVPRDP